MWELRGRLSIFYIYFLLMNFKIWNFSHGYSCNWSYSGFYCSYNMSLPTGHFVNTSVTVCRSRVIDFNGKQAQKVWFSLPANGLLSMFFLNCKVSQLLSLELSHSLYYLYIYSLSCFNGMLENLNIWRAIKYCVYTIINFQLYSIVDAMTSLHQVYSITHSR